MLNPILQVMKSNAMANSPFQIIGTLKQMMSGQSPEAVMQGIMRSNPRFASFVNANKNKSPEQICRENGLNWDEIKYFLK